MENYNATATKEIVSSNKPFASLASSEKSG
jgi:hypothetical protein